MFTAINSHCSVLVLDSLEHFEKYKRHFDQLKNVKAIIFICEITKEELKSLVNSYITIYSWDDIMSIGKKASVEIEFNARKSLHKPGSCCGMVYTSGTTEKPKAVMLSHDNYIWTAHNLINSMGNVSHRYFSFLPLYHISGQIIDIMSKLYL